MLPDICINLGETKTSHLFFVYCVSSWIKLSADIQIVKLREREGQGVDPGRSLKGHLWMVDGGYPFPDALH